MIAPSEPMQENLAIGEPANFPTATELYEMIREAAYFRAERRGFAPGLEAEDWIAAEAEIMARFAPRPG